MNKYIAYYEECTYEGTFTYTIPFVSNLSIKELDDKVTVRLGFKIVNS